MTALVRYDQARTLIAECARIDEVAEIRDKAAALAAYARQRDDKELEVWVREIHLRACIRIGELVRELETAEREGPAGNYRLPTGGKSKAETIADAGLSPSTANRYEQLAGGREERAQASRRRRRISRARVRPASRRRARGGTPAVQRGCTSWASCRRTDA